MDDDPPPEPVRPPHPPHPVRLIVGTGVRIVATMTAIFVIYSLMPGTGHLTVARWWVFALVVVGFAVLVVIEIRSVLRATYPALRAMEVIATIFPLFLVVFSLVYLVMSQTAPQTFNEPLDHVTALYFTIVSFATVGFGDIYARTDAARLVVMIQIVLDLVFIGLVVRVLFGAVQRRRGEQGEGGT